MKKWIILSLLAAAVAFGTVSPFPRADVGRLQPVQTLVVWRQGTQIVLNGGQVQGRGTDWAQAMADLRQSGKGQVFLGTADSIVLVQSAVGLLPQVLSDPAIRPAAQVCMARQPIEDPEQAAEYLQAHRTAVTVQHLRTVIANAKAVKLPVLAVTEGGLRLYEP